MKILTITAALLCAIAITVYVNAFEFALGARYAGTGTVATIKTDTRLIQAEALIGPLQIGLGSVQEVTAAYPFTIGLIKKFPVSFLNIYLGGDITLYSLPASMGHFAWSMQAKTGIEVKFGIFGAYGGFGYAYVEPDKTTNLTWETGLRTYIFR